MDDNRLTAGKSAGVVLRSVHVRLAGDSFERGTGVLSSEAERLMGDVQVDGDNLHREENITDLKVGSIRVLTPIKIDGSDDGTRNVLYMGQTQLVSQMGPLPVSCEIDASSLQDAVEKFPAAIKLAVKKMFEEVKEMQREQASQIVVPGAVPPGNIQLR